MKRPIIVSTASSLLFAAGLSLMLAGVALLPLTQTQSLTDGLTFFGLGTAIAVGSFIVRERIPDQRVMERLQSIEKKLEALSNEIKSLKP